MVEQGPPFPEDWLRRRNADEAAGDLDLAVLLLNSLDLLAEPTDRLEGLAWLRAAFSAVGHGAIGGQLEEGDLSGLRRLRESLRQVFEAADDATAARLLNPLLIEGNALPLLVVETAGATRLAVAPDRGGLAALTARLPAAVAAFVAERGVRRLGTCAAGPCTCAYVDRTRGGTRRFCCSYCNDRAAARSYRARSRARGSGRPA